MLDQHLTRPEEDQEEEEEVAEHEVTFLDALKRLEAGRKYIHLFETVNTVTVMSNEVENELYSLRAQEKRSKGLMWNG
jgi:hypothetical protein